jgi:hypothetical protein
MNKHTLAGIILAVIGLGILILGFSYNDMYKGLNPGLFEPADNASSSMSNTPIDNATDAAIRAQVQAFGSRLKDVSLLAPPAQLKKDMQAAYGEYLTPELLAAWQANPAIALGRQTSSPWPDRIEIGSVTKNADDSYAVHGTVIEIASADANKSITPSQPVTTYPVTLTMVRSGNDWLISKMEKGTYSEIPHQITMKATWECLPHKDTSGPQTMECAFGVQDQHGKKHYAIDTNQLQGGPIDFPTGTSVELEGTYVAAEMLNNDAWQKYDIQGIISVTSIRKI